MSTNDSTPPPPRGREALEVLETAVPDAEAGLPQTAAKATLVDATFTEADAEAVLEALLNRGYLYAVDDEIRLTSG